MPFKLLKHQEEPAKLLLLAIKERRSVLVSAPAGSGKTYPVVRAIKQAQELGYLPKETLKICSIGYIAPKAARIQQHRVVAGDGVKHALVTSPSSLRSSFGEIFIDWIPTKLRDGNLAEEPVWNKEEIPDLIIADECHWAKNADSQQGKILLQYIKQGGLVIFISFTPFQKVIEAKCIAIGCGLCTENSWLSYAYGVAGNAELTANSPAATKRIKDDLIDKGAWITFKNVYWKHKAKIKTRLIDFNSPEDAECYANAYEEYLEKLNALGRYGPSGIAEIFVALLKFWQCAELLKSKQIATYGRLIQEREGKQIIIASNFVESLRAVWSNLKREGVKPEKIGFLVGGQSDKERQGYIDKFQSGEIDYLLLTIKTGGTSLSLHHDRVTSRPRHVILPLTWSVFDMAQVLGRAHRINSLSDTYQDILGYRNTIEGTRILPRLDSKLKCLRELLEKKDSFILDILNQEANEEVKERILAELEKDEEGDDNNNSFDSEMLMTEDETEQKQLMI